MHKAPWRIPAPPHPVVARPRMKIAELFADAEIIEPSSNRRTEKRYVSLATKEFIGDSKNRLKCCQGDQVGSAVPLSNVPRQRAVTMVSLLNIEA